MSIRNTCNWSCWSFNVKWVSQRWEMMSGRSSALISLLCTASEDCLNTGFMKGSGTLRTKGLYWNVWINVFFSAVMGTSIICIYFSKYVHTTGAPCASFLILKHVLYQWDIFINLKISPCALWNYWEYFSFYCPSFYRPNECFFLYFVQCKDFYVLVSASPWTSFLTLFPSSTSSQGRVQGVAWGGTGHPWNLIGHPWCHSSTLNYDWLFSRSKAGPSNQQFGE